MPTYQVIDSIVLEEKTSRVSDPSLDLMDCDYVKQVECYDN